MSQTPGQPDPAMSAAFSRAVDLSGLQQRSTQASPTGQPSQDGTRGGGHSSPYVIDVTEATFEQVLQASTRVPVVIDLWATWCEPCKQLSPTLERLAAEGNGTWILAKVDVDANPRIAQAFQAQSIPMVVALAGGQPVAAFQGAQPESQVRQWISGLIDQLREQLPGIKEAAEAAGSPEPEPEDPRLTRAHEATDRGDHAAAAAAYREILAAEPGHEEATSGLAWAELLARSAEIPADAVERADADPADVALAIAAADAQVATGSTAAGLDRLVTAVRLNRDDARSAAREHLLELFALFAPDDTEVVAARRALAAALY